MITNETSLRSWLSNKPHNIQVALVARCGLRALPGLGFLTRDTILKVDITAFRALITACVRTTRDLSVKSAAAPFSTSEEIESAFFSAEERLGKTFFDACETDASYLDRQFGGTPLFNEPLWPTGIPGALYEPLNALRTIWEEEKETRDFFARWYEGMLIGAPTPWDTQFAVLQIPDSIWEENQRLAKEIARIEPPILANSKNFNTLDSSSNPVVFVRQRVEENRDAIAVSSSAILALIKGEKERIRGSNSMEPEERQRILKALDELLTQVSALLSSLPRPGDELEDEDAQKITNWVQQFKPLLRKKSLEYVAPENVVEAAIPTAIILGCTGLGSMLGMPLAGAAVGGLITNQVKPGKAAQDLLRSDRPDIKE